MARRLRFDVSRRRLLQSLGLGAAAGPLIPLLNASAQTAPRPKRLLLLFTPDGCGAGLQHTVRLEADGDRDRLQRSLDPHAARAVQGEDRRPLGPDDDRGRRGRGARLRDGGPVVRHDAARAEQRRQLRRRQRPPDRLGRRAVDRSASSRRPTARTCPISARRRTRTRRRATERSRSACSAATRTR